MTVVAGAEKQEKKSAKKEPAVKAEAAKAE